LPAIAELLSPSPEMTLTHERQGAGQACQPGKPISSVGPGTSVQGGGDRAQSLGHVVRRGRVLGVEHPLLGQAGEDGEQDRPDLPRGRYVLDVRTVRGMTETTDAPPLRRRLAGLPSGRRTKFLVLALWLVLASLAGPLAAKLTEVQSTDALGALPEDAEAARAVERAEAEFADSDRFVAVAVYARETGLTDADLAKVETDRAAFARYAEGGDVPAPVPSDDGHGLRSTG
jgi:hypothetical protein